MFDKGCLIVAEVAQAHDGSLGLAHSFIDAAARAGAGAVKFQTHIAAAESTPSERWRTKFSRQDASRFDYWKRMEFTEEQWMGLKLHAEEAGLVFLSSPFSLEAVELLMRVGVDAWKIASGEAADTAMLKLMASTGKPVLFSTGMSTLKEIDEGVSHIRDLGLEPVVLQCTSMYPTPPERLGLNMINVYRDRFGCRVGLSDHSGTIFAGLAAATLGIDVLEVHLTLSRDMFGPDVPVSLTPEELRLLVDGVRFVERARNAPVDKDDVAQELHPMRDLFTKSIVSVRDLPAGTILQRQDLAAKKPGTGIPAAKIELFVGRKLARDVKTDELLQEDHLA